MMKWVIKNIDSGAYARYSPNDELIIFEDRELATSTLMGNEVTMMYEADYDYDQLTVEGK